MKNYVNLYIKPEVQEALDKLAKHYGLPSKSAVVSFLVTKEMRSRKLDQVPVSWPEVIVAPAKSIKKD